MHQKCVRGCCRAILAAGRMVEYDMYVIDERKVQVPETQRACVVVVWYDTTYHTAFCALHV